jgi:exopolysaccharide biosynthesis polyprenyl glycosylphosphotransferase
VGRPGLAWLRRLHVAADCVLVSLGWLGAYAARFALNDLVGTPINPFRRYVEALPLVVIPWVATCWLFGIYRGARLRTLVDELQALLRGSALGLLVVSALSFFFRELEFGRFVVLASAANNLVLQGVSRVAFYRAERRMWRSGAHDVPVLIVGAGVAAIRLLQKLQDHPEIGYRVVGVLDDAAAAGEKDVAGQPVLGRVDELRAVALASRVREVFVADPSLGHTRMLSLVLDCEDLGIEFRVVTNLFEVLTAGTELDLVDDLPLVRLGRERAHPLYEAAKRVFDVCGAVFGLVALAPFLLWCAGRIRATSPGPALFAQLRVGRGGRLFRMIKFRTMYAGVEPEAVAPTGPGDPRVTPYGRWLRATSIDELPQLWNVLRGEMSLVGPRPEMPFIVAGYDEWQRRRLSVKPGITGLWQILGRKDLPMHRNLQYDFYYIRNRSLALDASILLRTAGAVLSRRGAF